MPGAVANATTANTSATSPIPSRVGQDRRILNVAVTLFVLAFLTSWNAHLLLLPHSPPAPGHARSTEIRRPRPSAQRGRPSGQSQQALCRPREPFESWQTLSTTVFPDDLLEPFSHLSTGAAHSANIVDAQPFITEPVQRSQARGRGVRDQEG